MKNWYCNRWMWDVGISEHLNKCGINSLDYCLSQVYKELLSLPPYLGMQTSVQVQGRPRDICGKWNRRAMACSAVSVVRCSKQVLHTHFISFQQFARSRCHLDWPLATAFLSRWIPSCCSSHRSDLGTSECWYGMVCCHWCDGLGDGTFAWCNVRSGNWPWKKSTLRTWSLATRPSATAENPHNGRELLLCWKE